MRIFDIIIVNFFVIIIVTWSSNYLLRINISYWSHRIVCNNFYKNSYMKLYIFTKDWIDSIHRGKMEQIFLAYGLPEETVAAIMMPYRNTKVKVRFPDGDTDYLDIVAGVLQGDTLAPYLFIKCLDYVFRTAVDKIKENSFKLTKERSRSYSRKNNYRHWLRRWYSTSGKFTRPSRNPAT